MASRKITALYETEGDARRAEGELVSAGIPREHVNIVDQGSTGETSNTGSEHQGFWGSIKSMFMPDEDRAGYEEGLRRGAYLLIAHVDDDRVDEAIRVLDGTNAIDLDQRTAEWRAAGWNDASTSGTASAGAARTAAASLGAAASGSASAAGTSRTGEEQRIPIVEEQLRVGKREVNRGSVRVRAYVVEQPVHEQVRLREEHVEVERRPVDTPLEPVAAGGNQDLLQERTIELTESAEEAVVQKDARVREELVVRKRAEERVEDVEDTVRHTEVDVDDERADATLTASRRRKPEGPREERR